MAVTDPLAFVAINAPFMTLTELQAELKTNASHVMTLCKKAGVKPTTIRERHEEYIRKNIHRSTSEILEHLDMTVANLRNVLKAMGIVLPKPKDYGKPLSDFNEGFGKAPVNKPKVDLKRTRAAVWNEFVNKYSGGVSFEELIYPKNDASWNI